MTQFNYMHATYHIHDLVVSLIPTNNADNNKKTGQEAIINYYYQSTKSVFKNVRFNGTDCMFYVLLHLITLYVKSWCTERAHIPHSSVSSKVIPPILKRSSPGWFSPSSRLFHKESNICPAQQLAIDPSLSVLASWLSRLASGVHSILFTSCGAAAIYALMKRLLFVPNAIERK